MAELLETEQLVNWRCVRCGEVIPREEQKKLITLQYSNGRKNASIPNKKRI